MKDEVRALALIRYKNAWDDYTSKVLRRMIMVIGLILAPLLQRGVKNNLLFLLLGLLRR